MTDTFKIETQFFGVTADREFNGVEFKGGLAAKDEAIEFWFKCIAPCEFHRKMTFIRNGKTVAEKTIEAGQ
tara:strand:- start:92 stop:304 length:213 start_codon:yes stop_codon:yes gene_type:complete